MKRGPCVYYTIYRDGIFWRWRLQAANHEILASGEAYWNEADCLHAIALVKGSNTALVYQQ